MTPLAIDFDYGVRQLLKHNNANLSLSELKALHDDAIKQNTPVLYSATDFQPYANTSQIDFRTSGKKAVAVVPLKGVMLAEGGLCTPSIDVTCNQIEALAANPNIAGIVLKIHSGGGQVTAAQRIGNALADANKIKPVVSFVDGMAASGAYWAACNTREIVMGGNSTSVGSIGVVFEYYKSEVQEVLEDLVSIVSTGSEGKREFETHLKEGNNNAIRVNLLDPQMKIFANLVKKSRGEKLDKSFIKTEGDKLGGRMTKDANEAIAAGLADRKGTIKDAVRRVVFLSKADKRISNYNKIKL